MTPNHLFIALYLVKLWTFNLLLGFNLSKNHPADNEPSLKGCGQGYVTRLSLEMSDNFLTTYQSRHRVSTTPGNTGNLLEFC